MANTYNLVLNQVYTKYISDVEKVYQIDVDLSDATADIVFVMTKNGIAFTDFTATQGAGTLYSIEMTDLNAFALTDVVTIQGTKGADESDKLLVDFVETYSSGTASYDYKLPAEIGTYTMNLDKVDGENFSTATPSEDFEVRDANDRPVPAQSRVRILKSYLVHFAGDTLPVSIYLNDTAGDPVPDGGYEVSLFGNLS